MAPTIEHHGINTFERIWADGSRVVFRSRCYLLPFWLIVLSRYCNCCEIGLFNVPKYWIQNECNWFSSVPAHKASNNYTFVGKRHYVSLLTEELRLNSPPGNTTYNLTDFSASEVLDNHKCVFTSFGIETSEDGLDLQHIYCIPKMNKNPYKHRFIAGSSKCSTKPLSILLTKVFSHI